jgi:hypothetical protein
MITLDELFGQAKKAVNDGLEQAKAVGVPAIQAAGEKYAANLLADWQKNLTTSADQNQKKVQAEVKKIMDAPATPGSFGSFLGDTLTGAGLGAGGGKILIAVGLVLVAGYFLGRK